MKLLEGIATRAVEASALVKGLANSVNGLAHAVENLAKNVAVLAHNQHVHHQAIAQVRATQHAIIQKMGEGAINLALPDPNKSGKNVNKDADKPN